MDPGSLLASLINNFFPDPFFYESRAGPVLRLMYVIPHYVCVCVCVHVCVSLCARVVAFKARSSWGVPPNIEGLFRFPSIPQRIS